jgi:hypothetical protein
MTSQSHPSHFPMNFKSDLLSTRTHAYQTNRPEHLPLTAMADTATTTSSDAPSNETPNQRQARLRREKRNAKMAATGEERLAKIKGLNGGVAPPEEALGGPVVPPAAAPSSNAAPKAATVADDPDEVDISDHPYTSQHASRTGTPSQGGADPFQQAMMQMQAQQAQQAQAGGGEEDPMAKMMQQLMGMQGGQDPNDPNAMMGGDLPQMAQMLSTMMGGGGMGGPGQQQPKNGSAYLWRIVHAISALAIAVYIAFTTTFSGSKLARTTGDMFVQDANFGLGAKPFYIFGTAELVLQTSRYFVEKGQLQGGGILATIANSGFVPEPYAQLIRTVGRYSTIYTTIVSDAMVVVFVLGTVAWWKGLAAA